MPNTPVAVPGLTLLTRRGAGASGEVYSARRDIDGWPCAVKIIGGAAADRFAARREIDVLTAVRAPSLVRLYDVLPASDGRLAILMDLVDGGVLRDVLADRGRLELREALGVLRAVFHALAALHARGIAHGDVSAGNVLLSRDGRAVLGDLGSARLAGECLAEPSATRGFIPPEVLLGSQPGPPGDVYAAGALAWLMLTGAIPEEAYGRRPVEEALRECPRPLAELVAACLAGEPGARPHAAEAAAVCSKLGPDEPLRLPDGPDLGGRLTHRLRARLSDPEEPGLDPALVTEPGAEYRMVLASLPALAGGAVGSGGGAGGPGRHRRGPEERRTVAAGRATGLLRATATRLVGAALVGALVGLALWWGAGTLSWARFPEALRLPWGTSSGHAGEGAVPPSEAVATRSPAPAPAGPTPALAPPASPNPAVAPRAIPDAPAAGPSPAAPALASGTRASGSRASRTEAPTPAAADGGDPVTALPVLLAARARAYAEADPTALRECYLPGSQGLRDATAEVDELRRAAARYEGLAYAVHQARLLRPVDGAQPEARVVARVVTGPYRAVVGSTTSGRQASTVRPEREGEPLTYVLRLDRGRWRIAAVEE